MKKIALIGLFVLSSALAQAYNTNDQVNGNCKGVVVERLDNLITIKAAVSDENILVFQKTITAPYRLDCLNVQVTLTAGDLQVRSKGRSDRFLVPVVGPFNFSYLFDKDFTWKS